MATNRTMNYFTRYVLDLDQEGRHAVWCNMDFSLKELVLGSNRIPSFSSLYILRTNENDGKPFYVGETSIGLRRNLQEFRLAGSSFRTWRNKYSNQRIFADHYVFGNISMQERQCRRYLEAAIIERFEKYVRNKTKQIPRDKKYHINDCIVQECIEFVEKTVTMSRCMMIGNEQCCCLTLFDNSFGA